MAERIVLQQPGSELRLFVNTVKPETVERNDYYLFSDDYKEMLVPQSSVKAQMERLSIASVEQMIGRWVRFGRSTKMSRANKPFWDIDWTSPPERNGSGAESSAGGEGNAGNSASAPPAVPVPTQVPGAPTPVDAGDRPKLSAMYVTATEFVLDKILPLYEKQEIGVSDLGIAKMVETVFNAAVRER